MPIVGTAGHVDHGKSTLVEALTGRDPDRWAEEKERGLTIDLGFAWADIEGIEVGFVDVPGHERFIKNMLAGVSVIDCALLAVAADSGWMPQTEEHASVLDLLNIRTGVIALTRTDLVDEDTIELATLEIMDEIEGTTLEGWPIVAVSAITRDGLDSLTATIAETLRGADQANDGPFKMWIDRAFTVSGAGVIVTGTVSQGTVSTGDDVVVLPEHSVDRVRGLHRHDQPVGTSSYGSRTAINLQGSKLAAVGRGSLVCAPDSIATTTRLLAALRTARSFDEIPQRGAFHLHIGSAHAPATIRRLFGTDTYLITLEAELPLAVGDRFILRDSGRQAVVGGGRVVDSQASTSPTLEEITLLASSVDGTPDEIADTLLVVRGSARLEDIRMATGGGTPSGGLVAGGNVLSEQAVADVMTTSLELVDSYHQEFPLRPGLPKAELATTIGIEADVLDAVVSVSKTLEQSDGFIRLLAFAHTLTSEQLSSWERARGTLQASFDVPRMAAIDLEPEVLHALIRQGDLIQITPDLVFTDSQVAEIHERIGDLPEGFSVSEFKEAFGMARRQAVPTLEWLDTTGWTKRDGDGRTVRRRT